MAGNDEELLKRLREMFVVEAEEHLGAIATALVALEREPALERAADLVEVSFRRAHTLKGAARAANFATVVRLCHGLETVFARLKERGMEVSPELLDLLHRGLAEVRALLPFSEEALGADRLSAIDTLVGQFDRAVSAVSQDKTPFPPAAEPEPAVPEPAKVRALPGKPGVKSIRVAIAKLDALLHQTEELVGAKLTGGQHAAEMAGLSAELAARLAARQSLRDKLAGRAVAGMLEDVGELMRQDDQLLRWLSGAMPALAVSARRDQRALAKLVDGLREDAKKAVMVPFSALFDTLPSVVRDLARQQGKLVDLVVIGDELEVDRRIQEELREALLHLVRNAVDHGIDTPAERRQRGRPERAALSIAVRQIESGKADLAIGDDGRGLDLAAIRRAAIARNVAPADEITLMSDEAARRLIFHSGVSTSTQLTDISGRGLGLAIVREKMEALGGEISVENPPQGGTVFRLILPISLASFRGVVARAQGHTFILPTRAVERVVRVGPAEIGQVDGRETIKAEGRTIRLVPLADLFGLARPPQREDGLKTAVLLASSGRVVAFEVDAVLAEQEVLMKPLGWQLAHLPNISGAAVLGSGGMALIVDVSQLLAAAESVAGRPAPAPAPAVPIEKRQRILVVEDSITARTLFKHVLEGAGYSVLTSVDGVEGWAELVGGNFDLVVSDIEMPRMNGIELTEKIRRDPDLAETPVVLISSLDSREDRERGVEAGANAYIVKRSFDQSDLLDTLRRLLG